MVWNDKDPLICRHRKGLIFAALQKDVKLSTTNNPQHKKEQQQLNLPLL